MRTELDVLIDGCRARIDALLDDSLKNRLIRMRRTRCSRARSECCEQDDFLRGDLLGRGVLKRDAKRDREARAHWRHTCPAATLATEAEYQTEKTELLNAVEHLEETLVSVLAHQPPGDEVSPEPETFLEELFQEDSLQNLIQLAEAKSTPGAILEELVTHRDARVRSALAENANTPLDALMILVRDEDADIRYMLAENHNLPTAVITALTEDDNPYVGCRAQKTLKRMSGGQMVTGKFAEAGRAAKQPRISIARA